MKNLLKKSLYLSLTLLTSQLLNSQQAPTCLPATWTKVIQSDANGMFQIISVLQIPAFAQDTLLKQTAQKKALANKAQTIGSYGFNDKKALDDWTATTNCAHKYVNQQISLGKAPKIYKTYIDQLQSATPFLIQAVANGSNYVQAQLYKLLDQVKQQAATVQNIQKFSSGIINNTSNYSVEWKKRSMGTLISLFPNYQHFFNLYKEFTDRAPASLKNDLSLFMANFLRLNNITTEKGIKSTMSSLERVIYNLQEAIKTHSKSWFGGGKAKQAQDLLNQAQEILAKLSTVYPYIITDGMTDKIGTSNDKSSIILFTESSALAISLQKLIREINEIVNPHKK